MRRLIPIPILLAGLFGAGVGLGSAAPSEERSELQAQLDQARQEVDRAVDRLAELLQEKMGQAPDGGYAEIFGFSADAELGVIINANDDDRGVLLEGVAPGSGADQAGLKAGDRLVMIDDIRLDSTGGRKALLDHMQTVEPDRAVELGVLRDGETEQVTVVAQPRSTRMRRLLDGLDFDFDLDLDDLKLDDVEVMGHRVEARTAPRLVDLDADLGAYFGTDQGVLVVNAPQDGVLKSGDVLLEVGGEPVRSAREVRRMLAGAEEPVEVHLMRHKGKLRRSIDADTLPRMGKGIRIIKLDKGESP